MNHIKYFVCLILFLGISACTQQRPGTTPVRMGYPGSMPGQNKVALLLPLSGPQKAIGKHLSQAAHMAVFEKNDKDFVLTFYDTKADPAEAALVAQQAVNDNAHLIIGPLFSNTSLAVYQRIQGRVPLISLSNNEAIAKDRLYPFGFQVKDQMSRLFAFLAEQHKNHLVLLVPQSQYGENVRKYSVDKARQYGQTLTTISYTNPSDMQQVASELKQMPHIDVLILSEGGKDLNLMVSSLLYYDAPLNHFKIAGTGLWDSADKKHAALQGAWYVAVNPERRRSFEKEYKALYGETPPRLATLTYDAVSMATMLARSANLPDSALKALDGFEGLDGLFRFRNGGYVNRALGILEVRLGAPDLVVSPERYVD